MAIRNIELNVKGASGYNPLYPVSPAGVLPCTHSYLSGVHTFTSAIPIEGVATNLYTVRAKMTADYTAEDTITLTDGTNTYSGIVAKILDGTSAENDLFLTDVVEEFCVDLNSPYMAYFKKSGAAQDSGGYTRPNGVPDGESIIANAPDIEDSGTTYKPIYYICAMDTVNSATFSKTGAGIATGADAYVFSDDLGTLHVGTSVSHTFDTADDFATDQEWKCRYVIAYATAANKADTNGIAIGISAYLATFEFIGASGTIFGASTAFGGGGVGNLNLRYINLENSSFYNNTISSTYFAYGLYCLKTLKLPTSLTTISGGISSLHSLTSLNLPNVTAISGNYFCQTMRALRELLLPSLTTISGTYFCAGSSLPKLDLPNLTTISGAHFFDNTSSISSLSLPNLSTISGDYFCYSCGGLESVDLPSITTWTNTTQYNNLSLTQFIGLPTNFDISGVNLIGTTGYLKSIEWLNNELPTKLKDNSSGSAKSMTLGSANIALIGATAAATISAKNWTIS